MTRRDRGKVICVGGGRYRGRTSSPKNSTAAPTHQPCGRQTEGFRDPARSVPKGGSPPTPLKAAPATKYVGIDVSKKSLDVASGDLRLTLPNTRAGCLELLRKTTWPCVQYVCEATGSFTKTLVAVMHAKRRPISVVPGHRVRHFAQASGRLAKNDRIDAEVIATFGAALTPKAISRPAKGTERLRSLVRRRRSLIDVETSQRAQWNADGDAILQTTSHAMIRAIHAQIEVIDESIEKLFDVCPDLAAKRRAMESVRGVGVVTAIYVLAELPEIGGMDRKQVASMCGLAPWDRESGDIVGIRRIFGGRRHLRTALFMAASVAARCNTILRRFYSRLRKRGKPRKVALTAVMRKLVIHLNHVARRAMEQGTGASAIVPLKGSTDPRKRRRVLKHRRRLP